MSCLFAIGQEVLTELSQKCQCASQMLVELDMLTEGNLNHATYQI